MGFSPWCLIGLGLLALIFSGSLPGLALSAATTELSPGATDQVGAVSSINLDLAQTQSRVKELAADTTLEEAAKAKLLEVYRQTAARLEAAIAFDAKAKGYRDALARAHGQTAEARLEISRVALVDPARDRPLGLGLTAEQLQQRAIQADAELSAQQGLLSELDKQLEEIQARPAAARVELAAATTALEQIGQDLGQPVPSADAPELERAQRPLLQARQQARTAEIQMLGQELLSRSARADLLAARRDLALLRISQTETVRQALQAQLSESRQLELDRTRQELDRLRGQLTGVYPQFEDLNREIVDFLNESESLGQRMDRVQAGRAGLEAQLEQVKADSQETERLLAVGLGGLLGQTLLELRRDLPRLETLGQSEEKFAQEAAENRLRLFKLDRELKGLSDLARALSQIQPADPEGEGPGEARSAIAGALESLLALKRESLQRLTKDYRDYLAELALAGSLAQELAVATRKLSTVLSEQLLWTRNALPLGSDAIQGLRDDWQGFTKGSAWRQAGLSLRNDFRRLPWSYILVLLTAGALVGINRRLLQTLEAIKPKVGKVREDHIGLSLIALSVHVLRNVPFFLVLGFVAWRLWSVGGLEFTRAVGFGLAMAALTGFVIQFLRGVCRPGGMGPVHFRWNDRTVVLLRHQLLWFLVLAMPLAFVLGVTQHQVDPLYRHSLGRAALVLLMVAAAGLAWVLLSARRGIMRKGSAKGGNVWVQRLWWLWQPLGIAIPVAIAALAIAGYYYSAIQIEYRLNQTVLLILATVLLYGLLHRWLIISQRKLALKVALERRDLQARSREDDEAESANEGVLEMLDDIDVSEVREQTQHLLRLFTVLILLVGLWFVWAGMFPALVILDRVPLWDHTVVVEGQERLEPVTLANLGLAVLMGLMTVAAARNMPGLLEITLLQRLPLDPGTRYATRTLILYLISITGLVLAFKAVGIGWSSVQWLAAALTVGLGFGLQEIFANFVSGLILLVERPIRVGDTVTVGQISGVVSRIRMRATTITDWSRKELIVPNKSFITGELINWSLSDPVLRLDFAVGISYGSNTALAHRVMLEACVAHPQVLEQPEPTVFFTEFGDNALNFGVRVFVSESNNTARTRIIHDLHMAIDQACREHQINIAFPQRDLHLKTADAVLRVMQVPSPSGEPPSAD